MSTANPASLKRVDSEIIVQQARDIINKIQPIRKEEIFAFCGKIFHIPTENKCKEEKTNSLALFHYPCPTKGLHFFFILCRYIGTRFAQ